MNALLVVLAVWAALSPPFAIAVGYAIGRLDRPAPPLTPRQVETLLNEQVNA